MEGGLSMPRVIVDDVTMTMGGVKGEIEKEGGGRG